MGTESEIDPEILGIAARTLGGPHLAMDWFRRPAVALEGKAPIELLETEEGRQAVSALLTRIEYGVYT